MNMTVEEHRDAVHARMAPLLAEHLPRADDSHMRYLRPLLHASWFDRLFALASAGTDLARAITSEMLMYAHVLMIALCDHFSQAGPAVPLVARSRAAALYALTGDIKHVTDTGNGEPPAPPA